MLTKRENLLECIRGGNPDRFVNQYEAFNILLPSPLSDKSHLKDEGYLIDAWGCTMAKVGDEPGFFPMHDMEHRVIKDIEHWREQAKIPGNPDDPAFWEPWIEQAEAIDKNEQFVTSGIIPGIFERCHHLCEITEACANFYEEPEAMHDLIKEITEWELRLAEAHVKYIKPEVLFHHDDWGTKTSTFIAPEMFEEFFLEPYKQVYGYYKDNGVQLIVHHSDTFGETLVPYMIDMGIDIWQGVLRSSNNIPALVDQYGPQLTFMGGIETAVLDKPTWTQEEVEEEVATALEEINRTKYFIPSLTSGNAGSGYPGVYEAVSAEIEKANAKFFA